MHKIILLVIYGISPFENVNNNESITISNIPTNKTPFVSSIANFSLSVQPFLYIISNPKSTDIIVNNIPSNVNNKFESIVSKYLEKDKYQKIPVIYGKKQNENKYPRAILRSLFELSPPK